MANFTVTTRGDGTVEAKFTLLQNSDGQTCGPFNDAIVMDAADWNAMLADQQSALAQARYDSYYTIVTAPQDGP